MRNDARGHNRNGGSLSRRRERRIAWLLDHPSLWQDLPSDRQDVDDNTRRGLQALGALMVLDGVYSAETTVADRTWGIRMAIGEARARGGA